jgi:hypothetical protein
MDFTVLHSTMNVRAGHMSCFSSVQHTTSHCIRLQCAIATCMMAYYALRARHCGHECSMGSTLPPRCPTAGPAWYYAGCVQRNQLASIEAFAKATMAGTAQGRALPTRVCTATQCDTDRLPQCCTMCKCTLITVPPSLAATSRPA